MISARVKGATVEDIAESLKLTPQAIYYRFRSEKMKFQMAPGKANLPEPVLAPEAVLTPEVATDPVDDPVPGPDPTLPG
jgi:hypothetical protein